MKLHFTPRAADELEQIIEDIRQHSPQGARNVRARIRKMALHILAYPYTGALTDSGLRRMPTTPYPYLIFYEVLPDEIVVIALRHSARDPVSMPGH